MCDFRQFNPNLENLRQAARDFAEFIKDISQEAGFGEDYSPFGDPFERRGPFRKPFMGTDQAFTHHGFGGLAYPRSVISNNADGDLVIEIFLPGFEESGVSISFKDDNMILRAQLSEAEKQRRANLRPDRRTFRPRDIERRVYSVPADLYNQAAATAVLRNGVLTVTIPEKDNTDDPNLIRIVITKDDN